MDPYPAHGDRSLLVVISGPSGAGKSTLLRRFLADHPDFAMSISVTTRPPRPGECEGVDYYFVSPQEFSRRVAAEEFLEYAQVFGTHFYGTPRSFIKERFAAGLSVIKDIDIQGAEQIRRNFPGMVSVFVIPPRIGDFEARLRNRSTESEDDISRRLLECKLELSHWQQYDYLVINDELERAAADLAAIVRAERLGIGRRR
jgi:guanylate kinase